MCGICGVCYSAPQHPTPEFVREMTDPIIHRGPDEDGVFVDGQVGLGMRRLKIIDLTTGSQPIFNEDKSIVVVFNGEIYNYQQLRDQLISQGHKFYTNTDTEVLVHLYEEHGDSFLSHLNGMFGIALWDSRRRKLILARDRLGQKPLYYAANDERIVFGSEIKSLLASGLVDRDIDAEAIYYYFSFRYVPAPHSIYKNIKKLKPGHYLVYQDGRTSQHCYWDFQYQPNETKSEAEFVDQLHEKLREAVRLRLVSDVPLGAFLSGGIDSSTIVGLMSSLMDRPVETFSIGFEESSHNELEYAAAIARHFNTNHHEFIVRPSAVDLVHKLAWHFDEPFGDSSALPTYYVSQMTRQHVTVALSGDGGDELFAGYSRYAQALRRKKWYRIPGLVRRLLADQVGRRMPVGWRGKEFLQSLTLDNLEHCCVGRREVQTQSLLSPEFLEQIDGVRAMTIGDAYKIPSRHEYLDPFLYFDTKLYLPDDILVKVDRMSMAVSLEARSPLLDHNVVEFAATIPQDLKLRQGVSKHILKRCVSSMLPEGILNRGKSGFSIPIEAWFRGELKSLIHDVTTSSTVLDSGILNPEGVNRLVSEHMSKKRNHKSLLWTLMMFQLWYEDTRVQAVGV